MIKKKKDSQALKHPVLLILLSQKKTTDQATRRPKIRASPIAAGKYTTHRYAGQTPNNSGDK